MRNLRHACLAALRPFLRRKAALPHLGAYTYASPAPKPYALYAAAGHVPLLADPAFCELAAAIGRASLGADQAQIWHLTKIYWYTVEARETTLPST